MKMKRALLIQAINDALKAHEDDKARYAHEVKEWRKGRRANWLREDLPHLKALRDMLTQKIRHGETITHDQMKQAVNVRGWHGIDDRAWNDRDPNGNEVTRVIRVDVDGLTALRRTLEAITDDEVSSAQLERLGFRKLYDVFRAAAGV